MSYECETFCLQPKYWSGLLPVPQNFDPILGRQPTIHLISITFLIHPRTQHHDKPHSTHLTMGPKTCEPPPTIYHHHHVVPPARISLTLSCHFSSPFIASGRSSGPHPVSSHSCWMYVQAGRPVFARPYVGVHRSTSLMSLSLLLQQWLESLVHLTWIVFVMGGRWAYSWCLVGCYCQDLFKIARSILV